jgi:hypothetical protein
VFVFLSKIVMAGNIVNFRAIADEYCQRLPQGLVVVVAGAQRNDLGVALISGKSAQ